MSIRDRLRVGWTWREVMEWVEIEVRRFGPTWPEALVWGRLQDRLRLFAEARGQRTGGTAIDEGGVMRRAWVVVLAGALWACGDDNGPSGLDAEFVSGIWDITVEGCLNGVLPVRLAAEEDGALTSAQNAWTNSEGLGFGRPLDGEVDLQTGDAEFHMWANGDREAAVLFIGTLEEDGSLTGAVTDPMPGFDPIFHFSGGPECTADATGEKR